MTFLRQSGEPKEDPLKVDAVLAAEARLLRTGRPSGDGPPAPTALSISGGGIRSATFALGAIQALAKHKLLTKFDYLSTVSGGGFVGSWLTAWARREADKGRKETDEAPIAAEVAKKNGMEGVELQLGGGGSHEVDPLKHLRKYASYLNPRSGPFSGDTWALLATILRNVLLNWMLLIPLLLAVLMVPRLYVALLSMVDRAFVQELFRVDLLTRTLTPDWKCSTGPCAEALTRISGSYVVVHGLRGLGGLFLTIAVFFTLRYLPSVGGVSHTRVDYVKKVLVPLALAMLLFLAYDSYRYLGVHWEKHSSAGSLLWWAIGACLLALAIQFVLDKGWNRFHVYRRLLLAVLFLGVGIAVVVWAVTNSFCCDSRGENKLPQWALLVTLGLPGLLLGFAVGTLAFTGLSRRLLTDLDREWLSRSTGMVLLLAAGWAVMCAMVLIVPEYVLNWEAHWHGSLATLAGASAWMASRSGAAPAGSPASGSRGAGRAILPVVAKAAPFVFIVLLVGALSIGTNAILVGIDRGVTRLTSGDSASAPATAAGMMQKTEETKQTIAQGTKRALSSVTQPILSRTEDLLDMTNNDSSRVRAFAFTYHSHTAFPLRPGVRDHLGILSSTGPELVMLVALGFALLAVIMSQVVDVNTFSLHGMYRNRLVRAYLGASNPQPMSNPFTGFDKADDLPMSDLVDQRPFHVVNLTLNLTDTAQLEWQQRKAASFTVTPLHCGGADVGYRPSRDYAGGITLGTAVAISGAAASPNMGYHSSPLVGFIMTLFNARLGCWLGNPGIVGDRAFRRSSPEWATNSMVNEALGKTSDQSEYVYLSDGGHFENLALYEMIRRRCMDILVLDGGCDPDLQLTDLGNALRKIRIDHGVSIEFNETDLGRLVKREQRWALGRIHYPSREGRSEETLGRIIYIKPMIRGDETPDVRSYHLDHEAFPHESTGDQSFDESQTESYRMLGFQTVNDMFPDDWPGGTLEDLYKHLRSRPREGSHRLLPCSLPERKSRGEAP
jgi:hypothetical protein